MVYVQDIDGTPLMPTKRHYRVRILLKRGEAVVVNLRPFTIRLTTVKPRYTQEVYLGIDSGTRHIGVSATSSSKELYTAQAEVRTDITELISTRRGNRRTRRNRLRYRPARFLNRVSAKREGWIPPSVGSKTDFHLKIIDYVMRLLPITRITIETAAFDIQKLQNPDISGTEYQQGAQADFDNVREYVLYRDGHKCQHCHGKSGDKILNVHHIESRKTGGNAPNNLVTLCETCHKAYHNGEIQLKVKRGQSLRDAAQMGIMRWKVYEEAKQRYSDTEVRYTYGYMTKHVRSANGIAKTHSSDARVISGNPSAKPCSDEWLLTQLRRHNRQTHKCKILKGGIRKRHQCPYLMFGYRLHDVVRYKGELCMVKGRRTSGAFALETLRDGRKIDGVNRKKLRFVCLSNRLLTVKLQKKPRGWRDSSRNFYECF